MAPPGAGRAGPSPGRTNVFPAEAKEIWKTYGKIQALKGVSLRVSSGEVLALLGPNGAGKTTLVRVLVGLLSPDRGEARLFGGDPRCWRSRRFLGVTPQETGFPPTLRVREVVDLVRAHYPKPAARDHLLEQFGLAAKAGRMTSALSGGERRRLSVLLAFAGNPNLVVLDEPTTGLDVEGRHTLWQAIRTFRDEGKAVLLTTHYLEEAEALADRVAILHQGRLLIEGTPEAIKARVGLKQVSFFAPGLPELSHAVRIERVGDRFVLYTSDADRLVVELMEKRVAFRELEVRPLRLEEAFLALTRGEA